MRYLLVFLMMLVPFAASAAPEGKWVCHYKDPNQKQQVRLHFLDGKLIVDRGIGGVPMNKAVIGDDLVSWKDGMTFEFFPREKRMTRTSSTGKDDLVCMRA